MERPFAVAILTPTTGICRTCYAQHLAKLCMYFAQVPVFGDTTQYLITDAIEGSGISANYEQMIEKYLAKTDIHWTHFLCIEDDMGFAPTCLHTLARRKLPVVGANYSVNKGDHLWFTARKDGKQVKTYDHSVGVEQVDGIPQGFTLIAREVLEAVPAPRFLQRYSESGNYISQDYCFCEKITAAGFPIHIDHDVSKEVYHAGPYNYTYHDALRGTVNGQ